MEEIKQGSKEWFKLREGKLTASRFGDVLANKNTKRYKNYQNEILCDLLGVPNFAEEKPWFTHGKKLEPIARGKYEYYLFLKDGYDPPAKQVPFVVHPNYSFIGCSPDGIYGGVGIEIKSRVSLKEHLKSKARGIPSCHIPQVQGGMWITGLERWDFVSYFEDPDGQIEPDLFVHPVLADLEYHKRLEKACLKFWNEIQYQLKKEEEELGINISG